MQEESRETNDINETGVNLSGDNFYFLNRWLNKSSKSKLEYDSLLFGLFGISLIVLGICILVMISTTYESNITNPIECTILNITHTHIKLCESYRCRIFKYCIPYVCTIIYVRYYSDNTFYESKLFSLNKNFNSSCSYEPSSCTSHSYIKSQQIIFLEKYVLKKSNQCCLHSITKQPIICQNFRNSTQYKISLILIIICFLIGLILVLIGLIFQLHINNYLKSSHKKKEKDFFDTILNSRLSNGTIHSSIEKSTPVNYDLLTQTVSYHHTPSVTKIYRADDLLLFDIEKENELFKKECLKYNYQERLKNEIIRRYQLDNDEVKIMLNNIEKNFQQRNSVNLPIDSIEKIQYLLQTIDNLEVYFPAIDKQLSIDRQPSPISLLSRQIK